VRDDFSQSVRRSLAHRVGLLCSNPDCRAHTTGPQSDPSKVIDVGVAAHITAASPGGPRFDLNLSDKERASAKNGIWLCQNCAKLIDSDVAQFSALVLRGWKLGAEWDAKQRIGKTNSTQRRTHGRIEAELKRDHRVRDALQKAMLKSSVERMKKPPGQSRPRKFAEGEFVVHRLGESSYPSIEEGSGISDWFKLESFDFYHNGIEGILGIEYALVSDDTRQWASLDYAQSQQTFPDKFHISKVFETGKIPWRNIRHYDLGGDEYYRCPHLYCLYANDGMPYEGFGYYVINEPDSYEFELPIQHRIDLTSLLGKESGWPAT
jgi:hypothetical protein